MDTEPAAIEWPEEHAGENRTDPAKAAVNISTDLERLETSEAQN